LKHFNLWRRGGNEAGEIAKYLVRPTPEQIHQAKLDKAVAALVDKGHSTTRARRVVQDVDDGNSKLPLDEVIRDATAAAVGLYLMETPQRVSESTAEPARESGGENETSDSGNQPAPADPAPQTPDERTQTMPKKTNSDQTCRVPGCGKRRAARGLCSSHFSAAARGNAEVLKYRLEKKAGVKKLVPPAAQPPATPSSLPPPAKAPAAVLPTTADERRLRVAGAIEADDAEISIIAEALVQFADLVGVQVEAYAPFLDNTRLMVAGEAAIVLDDDGSVWGLGAFMAARKAGG